MASTLKIIVFFFFLASFATAFGQVKMNKYPGKRYGSLIKEVQKDSSFLSCRTLTTITNKVTGVELYFKNDAHYVISFKKNKLNDNFDCESIGIRAMKIYAIHHYKAKEYQAGYCKCKGIDELELITPKISDI